ncbi:hypothetical protein VCHC50A1_2292, partial [Vibrio cholerae HC-50A1]
MRNRESLDLL